MMFSGRITGSLGGTTHDGVHTAPEGTEIYSTHMNFPDLSLFHLESTVLLFPQQFPSMLWVIIIMGKGRADIPLPCTCEDTL